MHTPRVFPKQQVLVEPEMPPIPESDLETYSTELETATPTFPEIAKDVKNELKRLDDLPKAKIADAVSLNKLAEDTKNMQMPKK